MVFKDFKKSETFDGYITNERYWFENETVHFWYRFCIQYNTVQDSNNGKWITKYDIIAIVDEECIHDKHRNAFFPLVEYGFMIKTFKKNGQFDENKVNAILDKIAQLDIEKKIKVQKYQKIKGILSGEKYSI